MGTALLALSRALKREREGTRRASDGEGEGTASAGLEQPSCGAFFRGSGRANAPGPPRADTSKLASCLPAGAGFRLGLPSEGEIQ
jgi:hypothetical protein